MFMYMALRMGILKCTCNRAEIWQELFKRLSLTLQVQLTQRSMRDRVQHRKRCPMLDPNINQSENRRMNQLHQRMSCLEKGYDLISSQSQRKYLDHELFSRMLYVFSEVGSGETTVLNRPYKAILPPILSCKYWHIWIIILFMRCHLTSTKCLTYQLLTD